MKKVLYVNVQIRQDNNAPVIRLSISYITPSGVSQEYVYQAQQITIREILKELKNKGIITEAKLDELMVPISDLEKKLVSV